jgi:predicted permease
MDDGLQQSLLALAMLLGGLVLGYAARKTGLLAERRARPMHLVNIVAFQTNVAWLTMWGVVWHWDLIRLPIVGLILSLAMTMLGLVLGRLHRFEGRDRATFALCCGMSNLGTTGGLLVIYVILDLEAVKLGNVFLLYWSFYTFLFCFPLARHFGAETRVGVLRLIAGSVMDVRTLPLAAMLLGLGLGVWGPTQPAVCKSILPVLILVSGFLAMFAIGVTLHLSKVREFLHAYLTQAAVKFVLSPLVAAGLVLAFALHGPDAKVVLIDASMSQAFYSVMIANIFGLNVHLANSMFLVNTLTFLLVVFPVLSLVVPALG